MSSSPKTSLLMSLNTRIIPMNLNNSVFFSNSVYREACVEDSVYNGPCPFSISSGNWKWLRWHYSLCTSQITSLLKTSAIKLRRLNLVHTTTCRSQHLNLLVHVEGHHYKCDRSELIHTKPLSWKLVLGQMNSYVSSFFRNRQQGVFLRSINLKVWILALPFNQLHLLLA